MPLDNDIRNYVNRTHANAWRNVKSGSTPDEPALVSSFLSSEMYRGLRVILGNYAKPGVSTLIRGIFTHQTPKVKISGAAHSTEIADLMLVHQHFTGPKGKRVATTGNALLFQAKRTPTTPPVHWHRHWKLCNSSSTKAGRLSRVRPAACQRRPRAIRSGISTFPAQVAVQPRRPQVTWRCSTSRPSRCPRQPRNGARRLLRAPQDMP